MIHTTYYGRMNFDQPPKKDLGKFMIDEYVKGVVEKERQRLDKKLEKMFAAYKKNNTQVINGLRKDVAQLLLTIKGKNKKDADNEPLTRTEKKKA